MNKWLSITFAVLLVASSAVSIFLHMQQGDELDEALAKISSLQSELQSNVSALSSNISQARTNG